ncbi:MAG: hypothetical protein ACTSU5_20900 [Promethearchaeota archaeon]
MPAAQQASAANPGLEGRDLVNMAVVQNVRNVVNSILAGVPKIRNRIEKGVARLVGAVYHMETGLVDFLPP